MPKPARSEPVLAAPVDDGAAATVPVWDPVVRLFHWSFAAAFALAWLTHEGEAAIHQGAGYVAGGLVLVRILWGILGSPYARFTQFVRPPGITAGYMLAAIGGRGRRYIGHNPAGGAMIVALLAGMALTAVSGWLMTTDRFYGEAWVEGLHEVAAKGMLLLVALHVLGVVEASLRHRENLVRAMVTGRKRAPDPEDIV